MKKAELMKTLSEILKKQDSIVFSFLFGSYARGDFCNSSDLDIAIDFISKLKQEDRLRHKEYLKKLISQRVKIEHENIDIIDIQNIELSLSSTIVEEGVILTGEDSFALSRFYSRTWSLEEDFYWRLQNENRALSS